MALRGHRLPVAASKRRVFGLGFLVAIATVLGTALLAGGCGTKFELPTERREGRTIAGAGEYQMINTRSGLPGIQDILLTPGGELFLLFKASGPNRARVEEFGQALGDPLGSGFPVLLNPQGLAFGVNRIFVLDQGDTNAARVTRPTVYQADCGPVNGFGRPIADLSKYWRVHECLLNGDTTSSFTDTSFAWVNGVAADQQGRVYVGGIIVFCDVDPFDPRLRTLSTRYRVYRYEHGPASGSVIGDNWRRDVSWELPEGTGLGFTLDPRGMHWAAPGGDALYFCDFGNGQVQKFADPNSGGSSFKIDFGGSGTDSILLAGALDVTVDEDGYIYVADTGNKRVLRYRPDGSFIQRVDIKLDADSQPIDRAVAVTADNEQVYVVDAARGKVIRYRRLL